MQLPPRYRKNWICRAWTVPGAVLALAGAPAAGGAGSLLSPDSLIAATRAYDRGDSIQAGQLLTAWQAAHGGDPRPDLLRLQRAWWEVLEGRDVDGGVERRLRADFETLEARCQAMLARHPEDWIAAYTLGEAHCAVGRLDGLTGSAWGALRHHQKGVALLERVGAAFPGAPEPRASIGVFRYYAARLPRSARALGRLVRVRGDRRAGLADLRAAAAQPGLQQSAARFFLVQILNDSEDDNLEALEWVLRLRLEAPRRVAVVLKHADVLADLDRPDLAVHTLLQAAADGDSVAATQCRFLAGRVECEAGRFAVAAARFDALGPQATAQVTWLAPWLAVYRAQIAVVRGDAAAARQYWNAARALPDAAGSRGAGEAAEARFGAAVEPWRMAVEEALAWDAPPETLRARVLQLEAHAPDRVARVEFTRGSAWLRLGEFERAAGALARVEPGDDEAALAARTATRRLLALRGAGDAAAAARLAQRIAGREGEWGIPAALASLARSTLTAAAPVSAELDLVAGGPLQVFRLKDTGFASVSIEWLHEGSLHTAPLALRDGWWTGQRPLPPGGLDYVFRINGSERVPDPEAPTAVVDSADVVWSHSQL